VILKRADKIRKHLERLRASVAVHIRTYPTPIADCDQQFNYLLELRDKTSRELQGLEDGQISEEKLDELSAFWEAASRSVR